jgi:FkbM family methyltransferase
MALPLMSVDTCAMSPPETEPPFGTYAPTGTTARLIGLCRAMPANRVGRVLAGLLRRRVMAKLDTPLDLQVFGAPVRFHPQDNLTEKRVAFMPQFFDPEECAALAKIIHPGFVFIDIGANAGFYSILVAQKAGKSSTIIAVEPQPEMARRLNFNIRTAKLSQIVHENIALAGGKGEAVLRIVHENRGASGFITRGSNVSNETLTVRTTSLLALMDKHGIRQADAIKIDIEGAEDQVLPPFFETCPKDRLPNMLIIERNDAWRVDCLSLAHEAGYVEISAGRKNAIMRLQR